MIVSYSSIIWTLFACAKVNQRSNLGGGSLPFRCLYASIASAKV